ncbi:MAG: S46 family peptidase [Mucinivorans sp.]
MKKILIAILSLSMLCPMGARADEGMWLLPFIKNLNLSDMQKAGFKLSAEDIYSINESALKDAIVIFGGGCTGEVISPSGLLITNHHCGYGSIQSHSSLEHDYLKNGFWAANNTQEIPTPGLGVVFIRSIRDVTTDVLRGVTSAMDDKARQAQIDKNIKKLEAPYTKPADNKNMTVNIQSMFGGNQYLLFEQERFGDVRLVGTPPSSIGKFGGETDNWMWPRHTGDFSMFRIYAAQGKYATKDYDPKNEPYQAPQHLKVSLAGVADGDYSMIIGFPGRTNRYMTSWEIDQVLSQDNPIRIYIRGQKQELMWADMLASDDVRIKYANKYAGSCNYWKNSIGMSRGLQKLNVKAQKEAEQQAFAQWVNADADRVAKYGSALTSIEKAVAGRMPLEKQIQINREIFNSVEFIPFATRVAEAMEGNKKDTKALSEELRKIAADHFKNYNASTDRKVSERLLEIYAQYVPENEQVAFFAAVRPNVKAWVESVFCRSIFTDTSRFAAFVAAPSAEVLAADVASGASAGVKHANEQLSKAVQSWRDMFARGQRLYLAGLLEMNQGNQGKAMYPDANFTMRLTYGNVLPYRPSDGVIYDYYTTLDGVMAKEDSTNAEFVVPARLKELWQAKDFGPYAVNGTVPVAFLSNNDITGGNSGSPIMNAKGELLGLAFDGNWEAMSGDIAFEPNLQRCISVDIRYVLFLIDKFAGAKHLVDEMTIAQ